MALQQIKQVTGTAVFVPGDDVDTDRIIPARFLKCVTFEGLGEGLFFDVRFDGEGRPLEHPLNSRQARSAKILVGGANFGCGSSREHAPQAVFHFGFRAIVAESFAEIFQGNCTTLGIPCVTLPRAQLREFAALVVENPQAQVDLDLQRRSLTVMGRQFPFFLPESAHHALLAGQWDPLGDLLEGAAPVRSLENSLHYSFPA